MYVLQNGGCMGFYKNCAHAEVTLYAGFFKKGMLRNYCYYCEMRTMNFLGVWGHSVLTA